MSKKSLDTIHRTAFLSSDGIIVLEDTDEKLDSHVFNRVHIINTQGSYRFNRNLLFNETPRLLNSQWIVLEIKPQYNQTVRFPGEDIEHVIPTHPGGYIFISSDFDYASSTFQSHQLRSTIEPVTSILNPLLYPDLTPINQQNTCIVQAILRPEDPYHPLNASVHIVEEFIDLLVETLVEPEAIADHAEIIEQLGDHIVSKVNALLENLTYSDINTSLDEMSTLLERSGLAIDVDWEEVANAQWLTPEYAASIINFPNHQALTANQTISVSDGIPLCVALSGLVNHVLNEGCHSDISAAIKKMYFDLDCPDGVVTSPFAFAVQKVAASVFSNHHDEADYSILASLASQMVDHLDKDGLDDQAIEDLSAFIIAIDGLNEYLFNPDLCNLELLDRHSSWMHGVSGTRDLSMDNLGDLLDRIPQSRKSTSDVPEPKPSEESQSVKDQIRKKRMKQYDVLMGSDSSSWGTVFSEAEENTMEPTQSFADRYYGTYSVNVEPEPVSPDEEPPF